MTLLEKEKIPPLLGQRLKKKEEAQEKQNVKVEYIFHPPLKTQGTGRREGTPWIFILPEKSHPQKPAGTGHRQPALQVRHNKMLLLQVHLDMKLHTQYRALFIFQQPQQTVFHRLPSALKATDRKHQIPEQSLPSPGLARAEITPQAQDRVQGVGEGAEK